MAETPAPRPTRPLPYRRRSVEERLARAENAFRTIDEDPAVRDALTTAGYTAAALDDGRALLAAALQLHARQVAAHGAQVKATKAQNDALRDARAAFDPLAQTARVAFRNDRAALSALALVGRPTTQIARAEQFRTFLAEAPSQAARLGPRGVTPDKLAAFALRAEAAEAARLEADRRQADARAATDARDDAMRPLDAFMIDLHGYAGVHLRDDPERLVKLGATLTARHRRR